MIVLRPGLARRMLTLFAARQHLRLPPAPVLRKAIRGIRAEQRLPGKVHQRWV